MFFYFLLIAFVSLFCYSKKRLHFAGIRINVSSIAFVLIVAIALLRFDVGWDYVNYYQAVTNNDIKRFEPLSQLFFCIAIFFECPHLIFLLFGIPTYLLIFSTIRKYSRNVGFSILLYFCFFYLESLGFIRQALAVAICFWAVKYIFCRRFVPFLLCIVVAILFHYSAVIVLLAYPLYQKVKLKYLMWSLPALFIIRELFLILLGTLGMYTTYLEELYTMQGGSLIRFFYIILFFSLLIFKNAKNDANDNYFFFMIGLALAFPFLFGSHLGVRLSSYFFIYYLLLILDVILKASMKFLYVMVAISFLLLTLYLTTRDPIKSQYVPYQFIFEIDEPVFREPK